MCILYSKYFVFIFLIAHKLALMSINLFIGRPKESVINWPLSDTNLLNQKNYELFDIKLRFQTGMTALPVTLNFFITISFSL